MAAIGKYEEKSVEVLGYISNGYTVKEACAKAVINQDSFYEWQRKKPEFAELVYNARKDGEQKAIADVEATLASGETSQELFDQYAALKAQLEKEMTEWEEATEAYEALNG